MDATERSSRSISREIVLSRTAAAVVEIGSVSLKLDKVVKT